VTLWRWLQKPEFQKALLRARRDAFAQNLSRFQPASSAAITTLVRLMVDSATPAASRVRAAQCVLDNNARAIGLQDLEMRLRELEKAK
jgi:hypothetical protein